MRATSSPLGPPTRIGARVEGEGEGWVAKEWWWRLAGLGFWRGVKGGGEVWG